MVYKRKLLKRPCVTKNLINLNCQVCLRKRFEKKKNLLTNFAKNSNTVLSPMTDAYMNDAMLLCLTSKMTLLYHCLYILRWIIKRFCKRAVINNLRFQITLPDFVLLSGRQKETLTSHLCHISTKSYLGLTSKNILNQSSKPDQNIESVKLNANILAQLATV